MGRKIRAKINSSNAWVEKMNALMNAMNTSSGLKLSLRWKSKTAEKEEQLDTNELVGLLKRDAHLLNQEDFEMMRGDGDIGSMDEDGFVYLDARIKRIIIRHDGFKVFPSMIENVISRHPAVQQCCVVGCADTDHTQGRLPFVFVVLDPAATGKKRQILRELRQLCREELPEYVQPASSAYKVITEMLMTPAGKADYRKLEEEVG